MLRSRALIAPCGRGVGGTGLSGGRDVKCGCVCVCVCVCVHILITAEAGVLDTGRRKG
jgi:hypothetical protein